MSSRLSLIQLVLTLILAFLFLREDLVTTLQADLCPRVSLTS